MSTGQGLTGHNMFAYCGSNPISRKDNTGQFWQELLNTFQQTIQQAGGCFVVAAGVTQVDSPAPGPADVVGVSIAAGTVLTCAVISVGVTIAKEPKAKKDALSEQNVMPVVTTKEPETPIIFPVNPNDFNPIGLVKVTRSGTKNGSIINWMDPIANVEVFRWDENPNYSNGPHYHIYGTGHYIPGVSIIPEPYASMYFPQN